MKLSPILIAHGNADLVEVLRGLLAPREVRVVDDGLSAVAAVACTHFEAALIEHPLCETDAPTVCQWLREAGALCPFIVLGQGLDDAGRERFEQALGPGATVVTHADPFLIMLAMNRVLATPIVFTPVPSDEATSEMGAMTGAPLVEQSVLDLERAFGDAVLSLHTDREAVARWVELGPPPLLIRLLDGTRTVRELANESGLTPARLSDFLRRLDEIGCLVRARERPVGERRDEKPWVPPEPGPRPDRRGTFADVPVVELLLGFRQRQETGVLMLETPRYTMRLDLARGAPVRGGGGPVDTLLGALMVRMGLLDEPHLERVVAEHRRLQAVGRRSPLGDVALRAGRVTVSQLHAVLAAQADAKLRAVLTEQDGEFRLYRDASALDWAGLGPRPVEALCVGALRSQPELREKLGRRFLEREGHNAPRQGAGALDMLPPFGFGPRIQRLLRACDGRTARVIVESGVLVREEALLAMYLLWAAGGIEMALVARQPAPRAKAAPPPSAAPSRAEAAPRSEQGPALSVSFLGRGPSPVKLPSPKAPAAAPLAAVSGRDEVKSRLDLAEEALGRRDYESAQNLLRAARDLDPQNSTVLAALGWATFRRQPGSEANRAAARALLFEALRHDTAMLEAFVSLGKISRVAGDLDEARRHFETARGIDPSDARAQKELEALDRIRRNPGAAEPPQGTESTGNFLTYLFRRKKRGR